MIVSSVQINLFLNNKDENPDFTNREGRGLKDVDFVKDEVEWKPYNIQNPK